jgi:hypothetical protein
MTTKLQVYNTALRYCGERKLATLNDGGEPNELLDNVWDNGGVDVCLETAQWKFAMRSVRIDFDPAITTDFGYRFGFSKPTDWVLTSAVCSDEFFDVPLTRYVDENDYWYCDLEEIYVRYISNDNSYGNDLSLWPQSFANYVAAHFANEIVDKLTSNEKTMLSVENRLERTRHTATNKDAMAGPQKFPAPGQWVNSRYHLRTGRDRGNRGRLIG